MKKGTYYDQRGMEKLRDGSDTLSSSLRDGAEKVKDAKADDDTVNMFATPVKEEKMQMTTVENNGHAMAPYMMSVGLWVGCLAFCLMYPLTEYKGKLKSGLAWWAGKASVAFTSIMYFFNITFGKVGSFLMLIFMVIQLAGSAGTYPVEISPAFVAKIHAYLPFTYTVNAFRSTIAGGESIVSSVIVLVLLAVVFTLLTVLQFSHMAKAKKQGKTVLLDWLEAHGVA